jgi:formate hydrogenlyase subunit 3/multisubunit Na+/H+ antiporter MnhD subunit
LFLAASVAICGLPPFNGFVSEFLIYSGLFNSLQGSDKTLLSWIVCGLFGLALTGGLAMLCFTKAFGSVFLGAARHQVHHPPGEKDVARLIPMYAIVFLMAAIGLFPRAFMAAISGPVSLFTGTGPGPGDLPPASAVSMIGLSAAAFIVLAALVYFLKKRVSRFFPFIRRKKKYKAYFPEGVSMKRTHMIKWRNG